MQDYNTTWVEPTKSQQSKKEEITEIILHQLKGIDPMDQNWILNMAREKILQSRNEKISQLEEELNYLKSTMQ